jgi:hypothetical protein
MLVGIYAKTENRLRKLFHSLVIKRTRRIIQTKDCGKFITARHETLRIVKFSCNRQKDLDLYWEVFKRQLLSKAKTCTHITALNESIWPLWNMHDVLNYHFLWDEIFYLFITIKLDSFNTLKSVAWFSAVQIHRFSNNFLIHSLILQNLPIAYFVCDFSIIS